MGIWLNRPFLFVSESAETKSGGKMTRLFDLYRSDKIVYFTELGQDCFLFNYLFTRTVYTF
jgi:hypothetical protein